MISIKTIIAGSRGINDYYTLLFAVEYAESQGLAITEVVSGCCSGPDTLGIRYAEEKGIQLHRYPAEWNRYGKSAGYRRNEVMAENAEALLAIYDGKSKGTQHMIDLANKHALKVVVYKP